MVVLLLLLAAAVAAFTYVVHEVLWEKEEAVDEAVFRFLAANVVSGRLTPLMKSVTYFAAAPFLQGGYGVLCGIQLLRKNWKRAVEIAIIGLGGFGINYCMKLSFQRLRPPHPLIDPLNNFSFPSGHATSAFIFYGLLAYLLWKTALPRVAKWIGACVLIAFSLLIGFSRVYLRVHYASDVAAGFCVGFAWLLLCLYLMERLKKKTDADEGQRFKDS